MRLTAVMYHYVRDASRSRYPGFAALSLRNFERQLDHLQRHFRIVAIEEILQWRDADLPAAVLTFDDGYLDHFTTVFPILEQRKLRAAFYPIAMPDGPALAEVNKIHVLLASAPSISDVVNGLKDILAGEEFQLAGCGVDAMWAQFGKPGRFDAAEVHFVKRTLQRGLPQPLRSLAINLLFAKFAGISEETLAAEFYATPTQLRMMLSHGHHIGAHTCRHDWLDSMPAEEVAGELRNSLAWLESENLGGDVKSIAYPYGGFNEQVVEECSAAGFQIGWTTQSREVQFPGDQLLTLPRFDTNEIRPEPSRV